MTNKTLNTDRKDAYIWQSGISENKWISLKTL